MNQWICSFSFEADKIGKNRLSKTTKDSRQSIAS